jgi:ABC transport system ATP-binding/permease protein
MPRLDVYVDYKRFLSFKLGLGSLRVGRSPDCDLQLPSEQVSRHHSTIAPTKDGGFVIEDVSTNGTRVNATMIHGRKALVPGDRIYIATYVLVYQDDDTPPETLDSEQTLVMDDTRLM